MLWRVVLSYACFGIIVEDGMVTDAAPIGRWMIGKPLGTVAAWVVGKRGTVTPVGEYESNHLLGQMD